MRASKYCSHTDTAGQHCLNLVPGGTRNCDEHQSRWGTTTRRRPKRWNATRERILTRDRNTCYICQRPATQVDHIDNLGDEQDANLAAICTDCHAKKTQTEAQESRLKHH